MPRRPGHFVIEDSCIGCGACEYACPGKVDAIFKVADDYLGRFAITAETCIDCGFCVPLCPVDCITDAREYPEDERPEVMRRGDWVHNGSQNALRAVLRARDDDALSPPPRTRPSGAPSAQRGSV